MISEDDSWKAMFDATGNAPDAWRYVAENLLIAADVLRKELVTLEAIVGLSRPVLMLMGFAVECLLKTLALKRGYVLARNGQYRTLKSAALYAHQSSERASL